MKAILPLQHWLARARAMAAKYNIQPLPFLTVWMVTLALFPIALWWAGSGVYGGVGAVQVALRMFIAWLLYKAPSLYILVLGRNLPWQVVAIVVAGLLVLSAWRFGLPGFAFAVVFLALFAAAKAIFSRKRRVSCERLR